METTIFSDFQGNTWRNRNSTMLLRFAITVGSKLGALANSV